MTIEQFLVCAVQLYEQKPGEACAPSGPGTYLQRRVRWLHGHTTPRAQEANAVPWDVMAKRCVSIEGLYYLLCLVVKLDFDNTIDPAPSRVTRSIAWTVTLAMTNHLHGVE